MIVRLKVHDVRFRNLVVDSFNSMIVRLKALSPLPELRTIMLFQFYDSPIKRSVLQTLTNQDLAVSIL